MQKFKASLKKLSSIDFIPLVIAYLIVIVFFAIRSPHFFNMNNFLNIALYASNVGILACTMTLIIVAGHIDLSIGSVIALSGIVGHAAQQGRADRPRHSGLPARRCADRRV